MDSLTIRNRGILSISNHNLFTFFLKDKFSQFGPFETDFASPSHFQNKQNQNGIVARNSNYPNSVKKYGRNAKFSFPYINRTPLICKFFPHDFFAKISSN